MAVYIFGAWIHLGIEEYALLKMILTSESVQRDLQSTISGQAQISKTY
jgi:hypothetical protein